MAKACKVALLDAGEAGPAIQAKLHGIMRELGVAVDPLDHHEVGGH